MDHLHGKTVIGTKGAVMGEADDITWAEVYLASDEAKFVTGADLVVDGGYTAR